MIRRLTAAVALAAILPIAAVGTNTHAVLTGTTFVAEPITLDELDQASRGESATQTAQPVPPDLLQPTPGDCDSWRPLLEFYELPWDFFGPILRRESNCTNAHALDSDDHSHGGLQANRLNAAWAWDMLGFDHAYMHTTTGAIHAAGALHRRCGVGPWTYKYDCGFPNNTETRWEWPST